MEAVQIGDATLYHGDCLDVLPTLGPVDLMVTDPPYGINWSKGYLKKNGSRAHSGIQGDKDCAARDAALKFAKKSIVFGSFNAPKPIDTKQTLVWHKPRDAGIFGTIAGYRRDVEAIFLCGAWEAHMGQRSSVLTARASFRGAAAKEAGSHPHVKPVDLLEQLIMPLKCGLVVDPFMGSGSTGVACMNLGRPFIGVEIERKYFEVACDRIRAAYAQHRLIP